MLRFCAFKSFLYLAEGITEREKDFHLLVRCLSATTARLRQAEARSRQRYLVLIGSRAVGTETGTIWDAGITYFRLTYYNASTKKNYILKVLG